LTAERFREDQPGLVGRNDGASPDGPDHFPTVLEKTKRLWLNEPDIKVEELAKITAPTLVMAGDRDAVPIEHAAETFRRIKGAQLCIIPGATHFLISEKPEAVNRVILDFLHAAQRARAP
jgi:pimeloyl-ACP methyl ester carboxylesterase